MVGMLVCEVHSDVVHSDSNVSGGADVAATTSDEHHGVGGRYDKFVPAMVGTF